MLNDEQRALALEHMSLAKVIAVERWRKLQQRVEFDELHAWAVDGLLDAARRFKPDGPPFRYYARTRIEGSITDGLRIRFGRPARPGEWRRYPKVIGEPVGLLVMHVAATNDAVSEEACHQRELAMKLLNAIETLDVREVDIVTRHYFGGEQFDHIAASLGLSKSWVSRMHDRALERLRKRLGAKAAAELL